jgi:uncharacterized protein with PIN domain
MGEIDRWLKKGTTSGSEFTSARVRRDRTLIAKEKEWIKQMGTCPRCQGPLDKLTPKEMDILARLAMEQRDVPFLLACWPCNVCYDAPLTSHKLDNIIKKDI